MRSILLAILLFHTIFATGQEKRNRELALAAYNVGFGGLTAGIGAVINKPKGQPFHKAFFKDFFRVVLVVHFSTEVKN